MGVRIQFFCGNHGRQTVEVSADMGGNNIHGGDYTQHAPSVKSTSSYGGRDVADKKVMAAPAKRKEPCTYSWMAVGLALVRESLFAAPDVAVDQVFVGVPCSS